MMTIDWVYVSLSVTLLAVFALKAVFLPRAGVLVAFGHARAVEQLPPEALAAVREMLLLQYKSCFWVMMAAGITATIILAFALLKAVFFPQTGNLSTIIGVVSGLANSALFIYFLDAWKKCFENMKPYFPPPSRTT